MTDLWVTAGLCPRSHCVCLWFERCVCREILLGIITLFSDLLKCTKHFFHHRMHLLAYQKKKKENKTIRKSLLTSAPENQKA